MTNPLYDLERHAYIVIAGDRAFTGLSALDALGMVVDSYVAADDGRAGSAVVQVFQDGQRVAASDALAILAASSRPAPGGPDEARWSAHLTRYLVPLLYPPDDAYPIQPADSYWADAARAWSRLGLGAIPESVQIGVAALTDSSYQGAAFRALAVPLTENARTVIVAARESPAVRDAILDGQSLPLEPSGHPDTAPVDDLRIRSRALVVQVARHADQAVTAASTARDAPAAQLDDAAAVSDVGYDPE